MGNHVRTRASASIPPLRPSEVTHARACRAGTQRPDSRSFKGASWPVRSCPSALRWMLLRRRWESVRARVERVEETLALAVTQLVRASIHHRIGAMHVDGGCGMRKADERCRLLLEDSSLYNRAEGSWVSSVM